MHDVCTEQHVGNAKCARPLSLSLLPTPPTVLSSFRFRGTPTPLLVRLFPPTISPSLSLSVFPALLFLLLPRLRGQNINDRANHPKHEHRPPLDAKKEEKRVTAASWPSVGSGVERWANACTGQDAFLVGVGSPSKPQEWSYGVCPSPSANFHPSE